VTGPAVIPSASGPFGPAPVAGPVEGSHDEGEFSIMAPFRVGLVEDDERLRASVERGLRQEGLEVRFAVGSGAEFLRALSGPGTDEREQPSATGGTTAASPRIVDVAVVDVAVVDVGLPDCDGRDLCLALRARGVDVPVLFLTARTAVGDRLLGFHAGGDDYLTKPFALAELVARVTALARRHVRATRPPEGVHLDPTTQTLQVDGDLNGGTALSPTEFRVLSALIARRGEVVRRRDLVAAAWADGSIVSDNTLDAYVARVRRKVRAAGADLIIRTVHGIGYRVDR